MICFRKIFSFDQEAAVVFVSELDVKRNKFSSIPGILRSPLKRIIKKGFFSAKKAESFPLEIEGKCVLFVGLEKEIETIDFQVSAKKAFLSPYLKSAKTIEVLVDQSDEERIKALIDAILIGTYRWDRYKTSNFKNIIKKYIIIAKKSVDFQKQITICRNVNLARDLINENADIRHSGFLEKTIKKFIKSKKNVSVKILDRRELKKQGLNLILAVNQGSANEPKLIIVKYIGAQSKLPYTAIVGKGITFDSGGLNLKPTGYIENMKDDMSAAAAVIGIMRSIIELKIRKNIFFVFGMAENAIGSRSYKPGDTIKSYDGKTVYIANTDAEGRLVLADAIAYLRKNYKPKEIIDLATLTGACVVALGHDFSGLMTNNERLGNNLLASARKTGDWAWKLPNYPQLGDHLKSPVADLKNTGLPKGVAGALSAGEFLRQFVGGTPWAHLDIAGTAFVEGSDRFYFGHGATGAGIRLMTDYLSG